MKPFVTAVGVLCLAGNAQAHVSEMPGMVHLAEHGWLVMALIATAAVLLPVFRRQR